MNRTTVSIIVPCFNESEGIEALREKILPVLARLRLSYGVELILVDDGSLDDTLIKLQRYLHQSQIIHHPKNRGVSAAIQTGVAHSIGDIVCVIDCDCTYEPEQLISLLSLMREGVDVVTASPYHPKGHVVNVPGWRLFLSKGLSQLYRIVLPQKLYTYTSMFRAFRREVVENVVVTHPGFLGLVEVLAEAMLQGYRIVECPAELKSRAFGQSKLRVARVIRSHLKYLSSLIVRQTLQPKKSGSMRHKSLSFKSQTSSDENCHLSRG